MVSIGLSELENLTTNYALPLSKQGPNKACCFLTVSSAWCLILSQLLSFIIVKWIDKWNLHIYVERIQERLGEAGRYFMKQAKFCVALSFHKEKSGK